MELTYRRFEDDDADSGYREAEAYALALQQHAITDFKVCPQAVFTSAQLPCYSQHVVISCKQGLSETCREFQPPMRLSP